MNTVKAVMYHYVRPREETNLRYLSIDNFRRQLDWLQENGGILSRESWSAFLSGDRGVRGHLLTFDDGLKDHIDYVAPELQSRNLFAKFYVCTYPLRSKALAVHLSHALLAKFPASEILRSLENRLGTARLHNVLDRRSQLSYLKQDHRNEEKLVKRLVNWAFSEIGQREATLEMWQDWTGESEESFVRRVYLSAEEIKELKSFGFEIGSHTRSHRLLSNLSREEFKREIGLSKYELEEVTGEEVSSFCFPFGGKRSYSASIIRSIKSFGYGEAISVEAKEISHRILEGTGIWELPRFDCNDFPFGTSEPYRLPR